MLVAIVKCGMSWDAARSLAYEEVLCLLHHTAHEERLRQLELEAQRIASLPLVDPEQQHRALLAARHRAQAELDRFHRPRIVPKGEADDIRR